MVEGQRWLIGITLSPGQGHLGLRKCQALGCSSVIKGFPNILMTPSLILGDGRQRVRPGISPQSVQLTDKPRAKTGLITHEEEFPSSGDGLPE